jgi:alpha-beta hydrolase superfamily lysophospholipase
MHSRAFFIPELFNLAFMKRTMVTLSLALTAACSFAQSIVGDWSGTLKVPSGQLHLVFHIKQNGDSYTTVMDSPDQGALGFATAATTLTGNTVNIDASARGISYSGTFFPDSNKINGIFHQGGGSLPLSFSKTTVVELPKVRPQDPKDFPYKQEEVAFDNPKGNDRLAGTLTMPADGKASKIVVLITGSGPQNRNEELLRHRPFLVLSDWLTRHGIAVLRYDDRGIAKSTGVYGTATTADFAEDAEAAVNYILSRPDLKNLEIGLLGHSEGGLIAPMVASRNKNVKFIVLLAGPGVPVVQLMTKQTQDQMRGLPQPAIDFASGLNHSLYETVAKNPGDSPQQLKVKLDSVTAAYVRSHPESGVPPAQVATLQQSNMQLVAPWPRYFYGINPADYLTKVHCPVLAIDGTLDLQVDAESNLAAIKANLDKAGDKNVTILKFDNLNHLMQKAQTGKVDEYAQISTTIEPEVLTAVSDWIGKLK